MASWRQGGARVDGRGSGRPGAAGRRPLLRLSKVGKNFGPVQALSDIDLEIYPGEVTALVGDNGAGKSTLIKTHLRDLATRQRRDLLGGQAGPHPQPARRGRARHRDDVPRPRARRQPRHRPEHVPRPRAASTTGCSTRRRWSWRPSETLTDLSVTTVRSIRQPVGSLSGGQRQAVAVARAVLWNAKLVIMDEPTAALGVSQTAMVLDLVRRLASAAWPCCSSRTTSIDVFAVADRLAALYLGRLAGAARSPRSTRQQAVELITTGVAGALRRPPGRTEHVSTVLRKTDATSRPRTTAPTLRAPMPLPGRRPSPSAATNSPRTHSATTSAPS